MDTTPPSTFDQDLSMIVSQLPPPVRAFFVSGKVEIVAKNLIQKYQLRIDQGSVIDREIILLLLGLKTPVDFSKTVAAETLLNKETISNIMEDINTQIFIPLREEERKGGIGGAQSAKPVMPPAAMPPQRTAPRPVVAGVPSYAPPLQSPMYSRPENKMPTTPSAPVFKQESKPAPWGSFDKSAQQPQKNAPNSPLRAAIASAQRPMSSAQLLEDHEEPHIEFSKKPVAAAQPVQTILQSPTMVQPQKIALPPPNLPGVMSPGVIPPGGRPTFAPRVAPLPPKPSQPPVPTPPQQGGAQPKIPVPPAPKSYATDPYREPIE